MRLNRNIVAVGLILVVLVGLVGMIVLAVVGEPVPEALIVVVSGAAGALGGALVPRD